MVLINDTRRNFVGGELSPSVRARGDIKAYGNGCEYLENFIVEATGPIKYRTGTQYVANTYQNKPAKLIPFQYSDKQSYLIEMTAGVTRFYKDGGLLLDDSRVNITAYNRDNKTVTVSDASSFAQCQQVLLRVEYTEDDFLKASGLYGQTYEWADEITTVSNKVLTLRNYGCIPTVAKKYIKSISIVRTVRSVTESPVSVGIHDSEGNLIYTNITTTVFTVYNHGLITGDEICFDYVGEDKLNGASIYSGSYTVYAVNTDSFALVTGKIDQPEGEVIRDPSFVDIDETAYYNSGYTVKSDALLVYKAVRIENPYTDTDNMDEEQIQEYLNQIEYTQNADTVYLVHPKHPPQKLIRRSHTEWELGTFTRTQDIMNQEGMYPSCVTFDGAGRIVYGGFENEPDLLLFSRGPDSTTGRPRYDDFTTGTLANDAIKIYLASVNGRIMVVKWLAVNNKYFLVGVEGGLMRVTSSDGYDSAFSAESLPVVKPIDSTGCARVRPVPQSNSIFYLQKGGRILKNLEYDITYDTYKPIDKNLIADSILFEMGEELCLQQGRPNVLWVRKANGELAGLTNQESEEISAWFRLVLGANENGAKVKSMGVIPRTDDYDQLWLIVERKINGDIQRTVEYLTDFERFEDSIDFFTDETNAVTDLSEYEDSVYNHQQNEIHLDCSLSYKGIPRQTLKGLSHLEGETVSVVTDGAVHRDCVVENGAITLDYNASNVHVGYKYRGIAKTTNLCVGGQNGSAQNKFKNVRKIIFEFLNSSGVKFGTDIYKLVKLNTRGINSRINRPAPLVSGARDKIYEDRTSRHKHAYVVQDSPLPCTVQALDIYEEVVNE